MNGKPIDIKAELRTIKHTSLMGSFGGPPSRVDSSGGKITRIRPFDYTETHDWKSLNPWKIEARGKTFEPPDHTVLSYIALTYKSRVYSENRVCYPMKRVDWDPKGERNTKNRGKSGYERISWDEAARIIAGELLRVKEKYGMSAVLAEADMHGEGKHTAPCHGCMNRLLSMLGGYTVQMRNMDSWEGWAWGAKHVWGGEPFGEMQPTANLYPDIAKNSELLLFWGCDPETTPLGMDGMMASRLCYWLTELGIKSVYICPDLNYGAAVHADKWIPVLPNTDAALHLATAYVWLTENLYDRAYVETHAVGYDEFFGYVLGEDDGIPKTPEWASEKCGVPVWTIKALARDWAGKVASIIHGNGGPGIRGPFSTEPGRLEPILLGMQGLGKPGRHQAKMIEWNLYAPVYPLPYQGKAVSRLPMFGELVRPVGSSEDDGNFNTLEWCFPSTSRHIPLMQKLCAPQKTPPSQSIPKCLVHDAILTGKAEWYGLYSFCGPAEEQWQKYEYPNEGCSGIHMIWTDSPCMTTCWNDGFRFVKALTSEETEFVLAQHPWMENDCCMADIILPVATKFELSDLNDDAGSGIVTSVYRERQSIPPIGESLSDFEAVARIAKALGEDYYKKYTADETPVEDIINTFFEGSGVAHLDVNDDFHKKDIFILPCDPDVQNKAPAGLYDFYKDPKNHPLSTPTGLLEFTSTKIKEHFPDDPERPPYPKWIEKSDLHDERLSSDRAGKYPLLCMSNHGRWRFHAQCDDIIWTREIETMKIKAKDGYLYEPVWLHPQEAEKRGIKHRDIVRVFNERGAVLCAAYVTQRLIPNACYVDHGARFDPIDPAYLDRGGAINLISPTAVTSKKATGMVVSGFLVEVCKITEKEIEEMKKKYPWAFARKIDPACGVCRDGWLIK